MPNDHRSPMRCTHRIRNTRGTVTAVLIGGLATYGPACTDTVQAACNHENCTGCCADDGTCLAGTAENACVVDGGATEPDAGGVGDPPPPRVCKPGRAMPSSGLFTDLRDLAGLSGVPGFRITFGDLDGDGYPDLVIHARGDGRNLQSLFLNTSQPGGGRLFIDATASSGIRTHRDPSITGRASHFVAIGDVDNDGDLDLFSAAYNDPGSTAGDNGDRSEILLNDGTGRFTLTPSRTVSDDSPRTTSAAVFLDYDRDGRLDLFVANWYARYGYFPALQDDLYQGLGGGTFQVVTAAAGMATQATVGQLDSHRPTYGATACDVDGDGRTDVLAATYGRQWNRLWRNLGTGRFADIAPRSRFDGDGLTDYRDNYFYACYQNPSCPASAQNRWTPGVDDQPWRLNGNTFAADCGDLDDDGDVDVVTAETAHGWAGSSSDRSQILLNDGRGADFAFRRPANTGFARNHASDPSWNEGDHSVAIADLDNDGRLDIVLAESAYPGQQLRVFWQQSDRTFRDVTDRFPTLVDANGLSLADVDRDGDLDIAVNAIKTGYNTLATDEAHVLRNEVGQDNNWLQVKLVGGGAGVTNRDGTGSTVIVRAAGTARRREVLGGKGHFGNQDEAVLTFGLGSACDVDEVEVRWNNARGTVQRFTGVRPNYRVVIREGADAVEYGR